MRKKTDLKRTAAAVLFLSGWLMILAGIQSGLAAGDGGEIGQAVVGQFFETLFSSMVPSEGEITSRYEETPVPVNISKDQFEAGLADVGNNIVFLGFHFRDTVKIEFDDFLIPNGSYAEIKLDWERVINPDGENILREPTAEEREKDARLKRAPGREILYLKDSESRPLYAEGKMEISVPIRFARVAFSAADAGQSRQSPPLNATLTRCENDLVSLRISELPEEADPILVFRDRTGGRLRIDSTRRSRRRGVVNLTARAQGRVAGVEVFHPIEFATRTLTVRAASAPNFFRDDVWPVKVPRYMPDPDGPDFAAMDLAGLKAGTGVTARRTYGLIGFNTPKINVSLPPVDNSVFARLDFGEPELLDARGGPIAYSLEKGVYSHETFSEEIRFTAKEGKKPVEFARSVGSVNIRYPARLKVVTLTGEEPKSGGLEARFLGPKVLIRGLDDLPRRPFLPDSLTALRAYDVTGRRLKKLNYSGNLIENNVNWIKAGFWGEVRELRIIAVEEWLEMDIPFDLPPAPELPESRRGKRPVQ